MEAILELSSIDLLKEGIQNCRQCPMYCGLKTGPQTPYVPGPMHEQIPILFVADSPGKEEYKSGSPFMSKETWTLLWRSLTQAGFHDPFAFARTNIVKCHQPNDYDGNTPTQILDCGNWLDEEIAILKPKIIVAFGNAALYRFSQDYTDKKIPRKKTLSGITEKHGQLEWSEKYQCWIMYSFSPRYVLKNPSKESVFQDAINKLYLFYSNQCSLPQQTLEIKYTLLYNKPALSLVEQEQNRSTYIDTTKQFLRWLAEQPEWAIDLETTGFDWYLDDVLYVSVSWQEGRAVCFQWDDELIPEFSKALESSAVKIMQNGKFDLKFLMFKLGLKVNNYLFDTQIMAHLLDENSRVGLDSLQSRYLGMESYKGLFWDEKAKFDAKPNKTIQEEIAFIEKFMNYACKDSDYTLRLKILFVPMLKNPFSEPEPPPIEKTPWSVFTKISMPLTLVLNRIEKNGLRFHTKYQEVLKVKLETDRDRLELEAREIIYNALFPDVRQAVGKMRADAERLWFGVLEFLKTLSSDVETKRSPIISEFWSYVVQFNTELQVLEDPYIEYTFDEICDKVKAAAAALEKVKKNEKGTTSRSGARTTLMKLRTALKRDGYDVKPLDVGVSQIEHVISWLTKVYDFQVNLTSPKEMSTYLYEVMRLPVLGQTPKGDPSTDKETMEALAEEGYTFPKLVVKYREIQHDISNYIDAIKTATHPYDGKVHAKFSQTNTVTGRLSCKDPALHGIKRLFEIRNSVVPDEGHLFVEGDLSQAEIRMLAAMSGDENLIDAFKAGGDIHEENARRIFKVPEGQLVTKEQRAATKRIVFAILYGAHVSSVAESLGISVDEAQSYFNKFYQTYPRTKEWMDEMVEFCSKNGYVVNYYGRIRRLPGIWASNRGQRNEAIRQTINAPIQGSATGDYTALVHIQIQEWLDEEFPRGEVTQVHNHHDAILLQVPIHLSRYVSDKVKEIAENADPSLPAKMIFDCGVVRCWGSSPMTDEDIQNYAEAEKNGTLPISGYCTYEKDGKICNNLFLPFSSYHDKCPDHWGKK